MVRPYSIQLFALQKQTFLNNIRKTYQIILGKAVEYLKANMKNKFQ